MLPKILTIILNYKNYEDTKECLESLLLVNYSNLKVAVVDNCSGDGSADKLAQEFPSFDHLSLTENYGFSGGNNRAIEKYLQDDFDYLFLLNNDTKVEKDIFANFSQAIEGLKEYDVFQAKMLYYYDPKLIDSAGIDYAYNSLAFNRGAFALAEKFTAVQEVFGACAGAAFYSFRAVKAIWQADGEFFDNDFFAYWEDADLSFRLRWRGFRIAYLPTVTVLHKRGRTASKKLIGQRRWTGRNNLYVLFKNLPNRFIFFYSPFIILGQLGFLLNSLLQGPKAFAAAFQGKVEAFRNIGLMLEKRSRIAKDPATWSSIKKFLVWRFRP